MVKNSGMAASRKIKTEPGTVIPRIVPKPIIKQEPGTVVPIVEPVVKQEYIEPDPDSTNLSTSTQPAWNHYNDENAGPELRETFGNSIPLGSACHTEKVEAKKNRYDHLQLTPCGESLQVTAHKTEKGHLIRAVHLKSCKDHKNILEGLAKILKTSEIDTFELSELGPSLKLLKYWPQIKNCAPFRFKTVKSIETSINLLNFLENCEGVENILLNTSSCNGPAMVQLVSLPAVINCKVLQVTSRRADFVYSLAKKWAGLNVKVPNRIPGFPSSRLAIPFIASKFGKRVIYEKMNEVRIRTNDEFSHILIRRNKNFSFGSLFSCTLISSNLLESECERSSWFKELTALGSAYEDFSDSD